MHLHFPEDVAAVEVVVPGGVWREVEFVEIKHRIEGKRVKVGCRSMLKTKVFCFADFKSTFSMNPHGKPRKIPSSNQNSCYTYLPSFNKILILH